MCDSISTFPLWSLRVEQVKFSLGIVFSCLTKAKNFQDLIVQFKVFPLTNLALVSFRWKWSSSIWRRLEPSSSSNLENDCGDRVCVHLLLDSILHHHSLVSKSKIGTRSLPVQTISRSLIGLEAQEWVGVDRLQCHINQSPRQYSNHSFYYY